MANSQAICGSFKSELMNGQHQFGSPTIVSRGSLTTPTVDSYKAALYFTTASIGAGTTAYTATGEATGTNYSAGGIAVTNASGPSTSGTTGIWTPSASLVYTTVTITTAFDCVLIYNSTQSNRSVGAYTFGAQTITAGTLTLTMPTNDATHALIQLA